MVHVPDCPFLELFAGPTSFLQRQASTAMSSKKAGPRRASSQPPAAAPDKALPPWLKSQAARLDAARQVYSGLTATTADAVFPILYTKEPGEAVEIAQKIRGGGWLGQPKPGAPSLAKALRAGSQAEKGCGKRRGPAQRSSRIMMGA